MLTCLLLYNIFPIKTLTEFIYGCPKFEIRCYSSAQDFALHRKVHEKA